MAAQQILFDVSDFTQGVKIKQKRIRYKRPTYFKSYEFTHINPFTGETEYNGDEKHIFRIRILQHIHSLIYGYCNIDIFEIFEKKDLDGLIVWGEDKQAEIAGTELLPIKNRLLLHIRLLRFLRKGFSVKEALCQMKKIPLR